MHSFTVRIALIILQIDIYFGWYDLYFVDGTLWFDICSTILLVSFWNFLKRSVNLEGFFGIDPPFDFGEVNIVSSSEKLMSKGIDNDRFFNFSIDI
jgi:hypothetical protein